jgi:hypothetical protein
MFCNINKPKNGALVKIKRDILLEKQSFTKYLIVDAYYVQVLSSSRKRKRPSGNVGAIARFKLYLFILSALFSVPGAARQVEEAGTSDRRYFRLADRATANPTFFLDGKMSRC